MGHYCLMCFGGSDNNPTQVGAHLKNAAGWASKVTPLAPGTTATVTAGSNDFLIHRKSATEYFILENRQQAGRDASLPDAGLAIWHVDHLGNNSMEQMTAGQHYECSLAQADARADLERKVNAGDATDLFGGPTAAAFGPGTAPSSHWWDGNPSGLDIEQISEPGSTMTFKVRDPRAVGQLQKVFPGGDGIIYAINQAGDLLWYRHDGRNDGSFTWAAGSPKKVGAGWSDLRTVLSGA